MVVKRGQNGHFSPYSRFVAVGASGVPCVPCPFMPVMPDTLASTTCATGHAVDRVRPDHGTLTAMLDRAVLT